MVNILNADQLIQNLLDFLRIKQPNLDTKPGTVGRDLFVELQANQLSLLYDQLSQTSDLSSLQMSVGSNLDTLAQNYGVTRKQAAPASGVALLTFASIPTSIPISQGSLVSSTNGTSFTVLNGISVDPTNLNSYRAVATRYGTNLQFLGITDQYAVEIAVQATTPGVVGNISQYGIVSTSISGVSNATNIFGFTGGVNQEDDNSFRNRVLAVFSGSNVGTALGYQNQVLTNPDVIAAVVVGPGDPLMVRDGTQVVQNPDGSFTILSEGTGGKVDVYVLGTTIAQYVDSFIYHDASNKNNPTAIQNNFVLGQIAADAGLTVTSKRINDLKASTLPAQPVQELTQVTGSVSGSNYQLMVVDGYGRVTGNYKLIKDTGVYAGSAWAFDTFAWIDDQIRDFQENKIKSRFNSQDPTNFPSVENISSAQSNISITNENSMISTTDHSQIFLDHVPATNVTRVLNLTTGERYTVVAQNPDGTGTTNLTGRVTINGNTLPSTSDILQVDYTWILSYDPYVDFDGLYLQNNPRAVQDSVDWGYSNAIRQELVTFTQNASGSYVSALTSEPISAVITANLFNTVNATVVPATGIFVGLLSVVLTGLTTQPTSINSIVLQNTNEEIYDTAQANGSFSSVQVIVGAQVTYICTIILPGDTEAIEGNLVTVLMNESDIFTVAGTTGNFTNNQITIPIGNYPTAPTSFAARINYIANVQNLFNINLTDLPLARKGNGFVRDSLESSSLSNTGMSICNENQGVVGSGSTATITMSIASPEYSLLASNIISVIRLSDGLELWNDGYAGTVTLSSSNFYTLNLTGHNSPANNDNVMILYSVLDSTRTQPMTFVPTVLSYEFSHVGLDSGGKFSLAGLTIPANILPDQIVMFRISDGLEISAIGTIVNQSAGTLEFAPSVQHVFVGGEDVIVLYMNTVNLRQSFTKLSATLTDQINNQGILTAVGTTITQVSGTFTAINSGLAIDVSEAVRNALGLTSAEQIPSNIQVCRIVNLESVSMTQGVVVSTINTYDVLQSQIGTSRFYTDEAIENPALGPLQIRLPATTNNQNTPIVLGQTLQATFYIATIGDQENLYFTRNGTVYGNKGWALIDQIYVSSGFNTTSTGKLTVATMNQPVVSSRYLATYNYLGPQPNERITINFNYNGLIGTSTVALEPNRPISADVLIKAATELLVDITLAIVVNSTYANGSAVVLQNVNNAVTAAINTNTLGGTLSSSSLVAVAQGVAGVSSVQVTAFNLDGVVGQVLTLTAQENQYFVANSVSVVPSGSS